MVKLFLVDYDAEFTEELLGIESGESEIVIVGSANSGETTLMKLETEKIDILLFNITAPEMSGIDFCCIIKKEFPNIKIIATVGEVSQHILLKIWQQRVDAIIPKTIEMSAFYNVIRGVMKGHKIVHHSLSFFSIKDHPEPANIPHLTETEIKILKLLGQGFRRKEAAHYLNISLSSIKFHCDNIFDKFNDRKMRSILDKVRKARIIK